MIMPILKLEVVISAGHFDFANLSIWNNKWFDIFDFTPKETKNYSFIHYDNSFTHLTQIESLPSIVPKLTGRETPYENEAI